MYYYIIIINILCILRHYRGVDVHARCDDGQLGAELEYGRGGLDRSRCAPPLPSLSSLSPLSLSLSLSLSVSVCLCLSDPSVEASATSCALTLTLCASCALPPVLAGAAMPAAAMPAAGTPDGLMRAAYLLSDSVNAPPDR